MEIKWTKEQSRVIDGRNKNMLVSAAAGSGKTAVLVERIISLITDKENPAELDRMLVVTFTKAAAGEMKERIRKALEKRIAADPEDELCRRQAALLPNAHISTIHGFCTWVIKNYFYYLDIDPVFRVMDEGEGKLMKADCMHEVLKMAFAAENEAVRDFVLAFQSGKTTKQIEGTLLEIYETVSAEPWPEKWLEEARENYRFASREELEASGVLQICTKRAKEKLQELKRRAEKNRERAARPDGPARYLPALEADLEDLDMLLAAENFTALQEAFDKRQRAKLSAKRAPKEEKKEAADAVKAERTKIIAEEDKLREDFFSIPAEELYGEMLLCSRHINTLCDLLLEFMRTFAACKRRNNVVDYSDLEHFALNILVQEDADGKLVRTAAAQEIAAGFCCVMIDEYQDSNEIQEQILTAVSGADNRFMVGDMKQSIYGFRHACPELFTEKYDRYQNEPACEVIDLSRNYRSREEVVAGVNLVFEALMDKEMGGIHYDERQRLYAGASYPQQEGTGDHSTELLLLDRKDPDMENERDKRERLETEAALVAGRIRELKETMLVWDKDLEAYRRLEYGDCAVLVRASTDYFEVFSRVLKDNGIPAHALSRTGYFSAPEVQVILDYLRILDNPLQDIPFAASLFSAIGGCSAGELAEIRLEQEGYLYTAARTYVREGKNKELTKKLQCFFERFDQLREKARYTGVPALLDEIFALTGYRSYAAAMPGGIQRTANLDMLLQKAAAYEKTSYSGLFNFIRYIDELKKASEDFGEANILSGESQAVRIMTIHKSKGLEFPVVFLCGCDHQFSSRDYSGRILVHRKMGIGIDAVDVDGGKRKKGFYKNLIAEERRRDMLSEELRVLYVALTRAKEKLILTMLSSDLEKRLKKCLEDREVWDGTVPYSAKASAKCYGDWILPLLSNFSCFEPAAAWCGENTAAFHKDCGFVKIRIPSVNSLIRRETEKQELLEQNLALLPGKASGEVYDRSLHDLLQEIDAYRYQYENEEAIPEKLSVSELKRMHLEEEDSGVQLFPQQEIVPYIPSFIQESEPQSGGAARGTAYHKFWKLLDYGMLTGEEENLSVLQAMMKSFRQKNLLSAQEEASIWLKDFDAFLRTPLAGRMREAFLRGDLVREQPFTMELPADQVNPEWKTQGGVLVQGIIDAYFMEQEQIVLLDYKTDHVAEPQELIARYESQLLLYKEALEKSTGKKVGEVYIYSTHLKKCVTLNV